MATDIAASSEELEAAAAEDELQSRRICARSRSRWHQQTSGASSTGMVYDPAMTDSGTKCTGRPCHRPAL